MVVVDYAFYKDVYRGTKIAEEDFSRLSYIAYKQVNDATYNRVKTLSKAGITDTDLLLDIKFCICECAESCDSFYKTGGKSVSTLKAGNVTESYLVNSIATSESSSCNRVTTKYLAEYGLLVPIWG